MCPCPLSERPVFVQRPVNQVVLVDDSVEFRCQVHGDPKPTLRWKKDDVDIPRGRWVVFESVCASITNGHTIQYHNGHMLQHTLFVVCDAVVTGLNHIFRYFRYLIWMTWFTGPINYTAINLKHLWSHYRPVMWILIVTDQRFILLITACLIIQSGHPSNPFNVSVLFK